MIKKRTNTKQNKRDFGKFTEISRELNQMFGDKSGRTISRRTAQGLKTALKLHNMEEDAAEDLVHGLMTLTPVLLSSKNDTATAIGVVLLAGLFGCYQNGKDNFGTNQAYNF
jgi:hypothetical protein